MARYFFGNQTLRSRKSAHLFLAFFWILGLFAGLILYCYAGDVTASLMRRAYSGHVSIVNLLISCFLPFLFSAYAVYMDKPGLLAAVAFLKAFFLLFFSMGTLDAFGSAGWLIRVLLMFSDICTTGILYFYWSMYIAFGKDSRGVLMPCAGAVFLIVSFDFYHIVPFLGRITEYS